MGQNGSRICGNCGTANSVTDNICSNCGYSLASDRSNLVGEISSVPKADGTVGRGITTDLIDGKVFSGRYRVVQLISRGRFGAVYKATDERFQSRRVVALKEMSDAQPGPAKKSKAISDFRAVAKLLVQLDHPNLPIISDFFEEGDKAYLVMEFIEGKTLEMVQTEAGKLLNERMVMDWALQLCTVLHYLHTLPRPLIFRDMQPAHVMLTTDGQIKLIDFGIARIFEAAMISDTTFLGSPGYTPLEQYSRGQSDARSDIYALGATLFTLLTNELPLDALTRRIHLQEFVTSRAINPTITPAVAAIVLKAMAELPEDRYQTMAEMHQAISAIGTATLSQPASMPYTGIASNYPSFDLAHIYESNAVVSPDYPPSYQFYSNRPLKNVSTRRAKRRLIPFFLGRREKKRRNTELSLFAIARTTLERNDRAIVGKIYMLQAGVSQKREEDFHSTQFKISVEDPLQAIPFHILFHPGENIELLGASYQSLLYNPGRTEPQFISCQFRLKAPGQSYLLINFYRERQWLKTMRFTFDGVEQSTSSPVPERR